MSFIKELWLYMRAQEFGLSDYAGDGDPRGLVVLARLGGGAIIYTMFR